MFAARSGVKLQIDPSDPALRFQDQAGTTPVTADGQPYGRANDKSGGGNHVGQVTTTSRPTYRTDGLLHWAEADGVDDGWISLANFDASATDKLTLILGIRKRSDAVAGVLAELGPTYTAVGSFGVFAPPSNGAATYQASVRGAVGVSNATTAGAAPDRAVLVIPIDFAGATAAAALSLQRNSDAAAPGSTVPGAVNFISAVLNLFRRNNANTPAAVDLFGAIIVSGAVSAADMTVFKAYMAQKTGVTL